MSFDWDNPRKCLLTLQGDLGLIDTLLGYHDGFQAPPYIPDSADAEFRLLAKRCVTNMFPLLIDSTAQVLFVDDYRHGSDDRAAVMNGGKRNPFWEHWQASRLDARQSSLWRAALMVGHSFILTEKTRNGLRSRGISPRKATALFEEGGDYLEPLCGVHVKSWPMSKDKPGKATFYDERLVVEFEFQSGWERKDRDDAFKTITSKPHGAQRCPLTRVPCYIDLDGRTTGLIEPGIPLQDRINQTVFDLLILQSHQSFEVRTVTGMAPPLEMTLDASGERVPRLDENGDPIPKKVNLNAKRMLFAEDPDVEFGHLPAGNPNGLIAAVELAMKHFSAAGQIPPHYALGEMINVNADALKAAGVALERKNAEIAMSFGEAIERMMRVFAEMSGMQVDDGDYGEVVWRDLSTSSLAQTADALGKFAESLGIPKQGLWARVPDVTRQEIIEWKSLLEEERSESEWLSGIENIDAEPDAMPTPSDSRETALELSQE